MDYKKVGLKCGIEIHQQIDTKKLFCNCPSIIRDDEHDFEIRRKLNLSLGETGEADKAAIHETVKDKEFIYRGYKDCTCLVEFDEEPPHDINKTSLKIALTVSKMLNCTFVDELHVMRKIVIDGSNTSGFQRTSLIAMDGFVDTTLGRVGIPSVCLEEDSAKIVERKDNCDIYNLSRLGIPLIEIATAPDITTPEQAKEVCAYLGMILRSTGKVKRGLGTIRQDVNVSILDGARVEIKGAQDLRSIPKLIDGEVIRQQTLLEIKEELKKRVKGLSKVEIVNLTDLFTSSSSKVVQSALKKQDGSVYGIKLKGFGGLVGKEVQVGKRLGTEFSDYGKTAGVGGLFHSDELPNYGITNEEIKAVKEKLLIESDIDAFILVADEATKSKTALGLVIERAKLCFEGVPKEVRRANQDNTTTFLRPMPGSARMYPETDVKPIINYSSMEIDVPKTLDEQADDFVNKYGLSLDLAKSILNSDFSAMFIDFCKKYTNIKPAYIAQTLTGIVKDTKKMFEKDINPVQQDFEIIFNSLDRGQISKDSVSIIFSMLGEKSTLELVSQNKLMNDSELDELIKKIVKENPDIKVNALMGIAMKDLRGKADGKKIIDALQRLVK